eukprot:CAMPEP_0115031066 /NCGR_PEP_ID=MMETSP0216-20121206/38282_1 /TAXON_ID=223996 /ORGANISM="Protocruzia adherens, Strain Boccale" /LENGTH=211 /DNA_ID=CAMNT_0002408585 /DNA_START=1429 /DNA_END=2061 /DNA_ORIENTATION=+
MVGKSVDHYKKIIATDKDTSFKNLFIEEDAGAGDQTMGYNMFNESILQTQNSLKPDADESRLNHMTLQKIVAHIKTEKRDQFLSAMIATKLQRSKSAEDLAATDDGELVRESKSLPSKRSRSFDDDTPDLRSQSTATNSNEETGSHREVSKAKLTELSYNELDETRDPDEIEDHEMISKTVKGSHLSMRGNPGDPFSERVSKAPNRRGQGN